MSIVIKGTDGFVFEFQVACDIREKYRIVGSLIGCLPQKPRQNVSLGMPLLLSAEEVTLLYESGDFNLNNSITTIKTPSESEVTLFEQHLECSYEEQVDVCRQDRLKAIERQKEQILDGKRAKKRKQKKDEPDKATDGGFDDGDSEILDEITIAPLPRKSAQIQIPTANYRAYERNAAAWKFPQTDTEKLRYRIFKDFWERGYFLTCGGKFGGDFLVYPGDPARYHSFYIAVCVPRDKTLSAAEIASMGRLGTTVKKTVVLCSIDEHDKISRISLNWSHIS